MRRRDFIKAIAAASAASYPASVNAQQAMPVIGFLSSISPVPTGSPGARERVDAFLQTLADAGYVDGRNVTIEYRWAEGNYARLPSLAADLVARRVNLIVTAGGEPSAVAAKAATSTIPVVVLLGGDPMKLGMFASMNRPGGNITGVSIFANAMESKRLGLLHEALPDAKSIAVLANKASPVFDSQERDVREAAARLGIEAVFFFSSDENDFETIFSTVGQRKLGLLVCGDPFFNSRRGRLIALAAQHRIPAIYEWREFAFEGGLMSYGTVLSEAYRQVGNYAARILKGEKPGDLPVVQATKFEFIINLKTAKQIGLTFSPTMLARADDAIE
jgi:putative ABC transport system substrate-binding protein